MSYKSILFKIEKDNGIATLTFNRPDTLNAFNNTMIEESIQAVKIVRRDEAVRCLIITGSGRGFSSGQDLVEAGGRFGNREESLADHLRQTYHRLIDQLVTLEKPTIGLINGVAAGIGFSISLATDLRVASDRASFVLGFSRIGLIPDGGANWILPRLIGYARAYEMAVTNERISAEVALNWGLINRVYPHKQLVENGRALALTLASGPTLAFGLTKRAMRRGFDQAFQENLDYEAYLQDIAGRSEDSQEGIMAFLEKRPPNYQGR